MAPLPSSNLPGTWWIHLTGFLRSTHALIGLIILASLGFATFVPGVGWPAFGLFALVTLVTIGRYLFKGPEAERGQPSVSFSHYETRILNIEGWMTKPEFQTLLQAIGTLRRPLPAPAGIIEGSASNRSAIRAISREDAERLREQDNA